MAGWKQRRDDFVDELLELARVDPRAVGRGEAEVNFRAHPAVAAVGPVWQATSVRVNKGRARCVS